MLSVASVHRCVLPSACAVAALLASCAEDTGDPDGESGPRDAAADVPVQTSGDSGSTAPDAAEQDAGGSADPDVARPRDAGARDAVGSDAALPDTGPLQPPDEPFPDGEVAARVVAPRLPRIWVDGQLGEWADAAAVRIDPESVALTGGANRGVLDAADLAAVVALAWTEHRFCLAARVEDDARDAEPREPQAWWEADSVSALFDLDDGRAGSTWRDGDDLLAFPVDGPAWHRQGWDAGAREQPLGPAPTLEWQVVQTATGYDLEACVPLRLLVHNHGGRLPREAGFTLLVTDPDGSGPGTQLMWAGQDDDQAGWGRLVLAGWVDADGDGYESGVDCDDTRGDVRPDAVEVPDNGRDDDCDGQTDERVPTPRPRTFFQTNSGWDARIDLPVDVVVVHNHESTGNLRSWQQHGRTTWKMFFVGSDANGEHTGRHPEDAERREGGEVIGVDGRPYIVPSAAWRGYCEDIVRRSIDAGAEAILPEEPLLHAAGGYSDTFRAAWREHFGEDWRRPHGSARDFWRAGRLKADLYLRLVQDLARTTHEHGAASGRDVRYLLPVHSLLSFSAAEMVFPHGAALSVEGLDGLVGQVWTWPIKTMLGRYEGREDRSYFEAAWGLYSHFANLVHGLDLPLYLLADPVDDDPSQSWDDYRRWYHETVLASLLFPWVARFEVMPWPDRVFLPGHPMGGGTPGPAAYRRELLAVFQALDRLGDEVASEGPEGSSDVAFVVADTMTWERGLDWLGSEMESYHGPVLPLLKAGVPVQVIPAERAVEAGYLERFRLLLVTYDLFKPLDPALHARIAAWVRGGGRLLLLGGWSAFNGVGGWWNEAGHATPQDHLFVELGLGVRVADRQEVNPALHGLVLQPEPGVDLPAINPPAGLAPNVVLYPLDGARRLHRLGDLPDAPVFEQEVGAGRVLVAGFPAAHFAQLGGAADLLAFVRRLYPGELSAPGGFVLRRGPFVIVRATTRRQELAGDYLDLFDGDLAVRRDPGYGPGEGSLLLDVTDALREPTPRLLFANQRVTGLAEGEAETAFSAEGPAGTDGVARLATAGRRANLAEGPGGTALHAQGETVRVTFPGDPGGRRLRIRWE